MVVARARRCQGSSQANAGLSGNLTGMPTFQEHIGIERSRVVASETFVSAVCRFNRDDNLVVVTRNDEYGTQSQPLAEGNLMPQFAPILRIYSVFEKLRKVHQDTYVHPLVRDVQYWTGIVDAYERRQNSPDHHEARKIYEQWQMVGLDRSYDDAIDRARTMALERVTGKLREATHARTAGRANIDQFEATSKHAATLDALMEWKPLHGHAGAYPPDVVDVFPQTDPGGHAEENLIRIWASVTQHLQLQLVELFLTRMPCGRRSEPFRMGNLIYKEGCVNKLIQLVADVGPAVEWIIEWNQELTAGHQPLAVALSAGFPQNVTFRRWATQ